MGNCVKKTLQTIVLLLSVLLCCCTLQNSIPAHAEKNEKALMVSELVQLCSIDENELPEVEEHGNVRITVDTGSKEYDETLNALHQALAKQPEYVEIESDISLDEATKLISYEYFNPETFWLVHETGMKIIKWEGSPRLRFVAEYIEPAEESAKMKDELNTLCDRIIKYAEINGYADTPENMARFVAVWIGEHCVYRPKDTVPSQLDKTAYGALVNNVAICSGFTAAFNLLMLKSGYDAYCLLGQNGDAFHAWSGYTGNNSIIYKCDVTKLAVYKGNELACWDESVNFTGDNGEYKEIGCNHFA